MKKFILSLIVIFAASATVTMAQDDMYFVPKKVTKAERAAEKAALKAAEDSLRAVYKARREFAEKTAFEATQRAYEDMMVRLYRRLYHEDVDAYNRHFTYENNDTVVFDSLGTGDDRIMFSNVNDTLYNVDDNYKYLKMISRFDNIMLDLDENSGVPTWFYPWYSSPTRLNMDWAYRSARYYNPYYRGWYGGVYDPWFYGYYSSDPWWYSWYDPWYDRYLGWGGYYGYYGWGYRPYYDVFYLPSYGYFGHHYGGGHYGGGHHAANQGNVNISKYGVRTITDAHTGRLMTENGYSAGSNSSYGRVSYGSSTSYTPISSNSGRYGNSSNTRTFTPTTNNSGSYSSSSTRTYSSSGSSYSGGSSRSYGGGGGGVSSGGGSRGAGGRH